IDMAAVLEGNAFEEGADEMRLAVPAGDAGEAGAHLGTPPRAVEIRVGEWIVAGGHDVRDETVAGPERIRVLTAARYQLPHIPFEIGSGGRTRFDRHQPAFAEGRDHEDVTIDDRAR